MPLIEPRIRAWIVTTALLSAVALAASGSSGPVSAATPAEAAPVEPGSPVTCADDRATLVSVDDGVLRCEGGVVVPRPAPWNADGCSDGTWVPAVQPVTGGTVWVTRPDACLVTRLPYAEPGGIRAVR